MTRVYYYRITFYLRQNPQKTFRGIRDHHNPDVDIVYLVFHSAAYETFPGQIEGFECVQVPSHDPQVKEYIRNHKKLKKTGRQSDWTEDSLGEEKM